MSPLKPDKEEQDKLEQRFREQLRNMEVTPPPGAWDRLETGLNTERSKIRYDHWYYAALLLLASLTVTNLVANYQVKDHNRQALNEKKREQAFGPKYELVGAYPSPLRHLDEAGQRTISQPLNTKYVEADFSPVADFYAQHLLPYVTANDWEMVLPGKDGSAVSPAGDEKHSSPSRLAATSSFALADDGDLIPQKINLVIADASSGINTDKSLNAGSYSKHTYRYAEKKNSPLSIPKVKGLYIGVDAGLNTKQIYLRRSVYPIINREALYDLQWGASYGVKVGYNFSRHFGLETEWIFNSAQNTSYSTLFFGKLPVSGDIHLSYIQVPLIAKYKVCSVSSLTGQPISLNILGGVLYSYLKEVEMVVNERKVENTKQFFSRHQLGLTTGLEYDIYLNQYIFFTLGARASFVTDINSGDVPKTNSYGLLLGINAGLSFQFPEVKKVPANNILLQP